MTGFSIFFPKTKWDHLGNISLTKKEIYYRDLEVVLKDIDREARPFLVPKIGIRLLRYLSLKQKQDKNIYSFLLKRVTNDTYVDNIKIDQGWLVVSGSFSKELYGKVRQVCLDISESHQL